MKGLSIKKYIVAGSFLLSMSCGVLAQNKMTATQSVDVKAVTESISQALNEGYIFPEVAITITALLKKNLESGAYDKYKTMPLELSEKLTDDIRSINNDAHLNVIHTPKQGGGMRMMRRGGPGAGPNKAMLKRMARDNFGFESVEILEGNVGYLNLTSMVSPAYAGETAAAAMQYLYNTDAIIFDLRENRGGAGEMYQLLASYLFEAGARKLNEIYWPQDDHRYQVWTLPHVPGKRMPNKDIYVLTSSNTGSAAEVFSYTLKHYDRATIVGEVTVGIANPVSPTKISDNFTVMMSKGEATHPITKTNFEGKGVQPHVKTSRSEALNTAHELALQNLSKKNKADSSYYDWYQEIVKAKSNSLQIDKRVLQSYEGTFVSRAGEERVIKVKNGQLWYGASNNELTQMKAISESRFMLPGDNDFKLQIDLESNKVIGIKRFFNTGRVISMTKHAGA